ncbi:hypothetical protein MTO96_017429 [Rhipicephalus appendiculatus]
MAAAAARRQDGPPEPTTMEESRVTTGPQLPGIHAFRGGGEENKKPAGAAFFLPRVYFLRRTKGCADRSGLTEDGRCKRFQVTTASDEVWMRPERGTLEEPEQRRDVRGFRGASWLCRPGVRTHWRPLRAASIRRVAPKAITSPRREKGGHRRLSCPVASFGRKECHLLRAGHEGPE